MTFLHPNWFYAVPVLLLASAALYGVARRIRIRRIRQFLTRQQADVAVGWKSERLRMARHGVFSLALLLVIVALARPLGVPKEAQGRSRGIEAYIALDVSRSMGATDIAPFRLTAAKTAIREFRDKLGSDRIGLILFAGAAYVNMPLSLDAQAFDKLLDIAKPESVGAEGTNIQAAIRAAEKSFEKQKLENPLLIIVSDGGVLEGDAVAAAAEARRAHNLRIYTVGVGTANGALVYSMGRDGVTKGGVMRDEFGVNLLSRLEAAPLEAVARAGGGRYVEFQPGGRTLEQLYDNELSRFSAAPKEISLEECYEWFFLPALLALILLGVEPFLRLKRVVVAQEPTRLSVTLPVVDRPVRVVREQPSTLRRMKTSSLRLLIAGSMLFVCTNSPVAAGEMTPQEAARLLENGSTPELIRYFSRQVEGNPDDIEAKYNLGVAHYAAGQYAEAKRVFEAIPAIADEPLRSKAAFQSGNTLVKMAEVFAKSQNTYGAAQALEQAVDCYDGELERADTKAVRLNRQLAGERLRQTLLEITRQELRRAEGRATPYEKAKVLRNGLDAIARLERRSSGVPDPEAESLKDNATKKLAENLQTLAADNEAHAETKFRAKELSKGAQLQSAAISQLEEAVAVRPDDAPLADKLQSAKEKLSRELLDSAERGAEEVAKTSNSYQRLFAYQGLAKQVDQVLGATPESERALQLKQKLLDGMEQAALEEGDRSKDNYEKSPDATNKMDHLARAVDMYRKALEANSESAPAKSRLGELEPKLGEAFAEMGKSEFSKANALMKADPPPDGKGDPGKSTDEKSTPEGASDLAKLDDQQISAVISHMEKATGAFSQAEALGKMTLELDAMRSQASQTMDALRNELQKRMAADKSKGSDPAKKPGGETKEESLAEDSGDHPPVLTYGETVGRKRSVNYNSKEAGKPRRNW